MTTNPQRYPKFVWIATLLCLLAIAVMCGLGMWQLDRMEQKQTRLAQIELRKSGSRLTLHEAVSSADDVRDIPIVASGRWLLEKAMWLDNRIVGGQVGYELIVPFQAVDYLLLVNLGWVAAPATRDELPVLPEMPETTEIQGTLAVPNINPMVREMSDNHQFPLRIQQLNLDWLAARTQLPLAPFVVYLESPSLPGFVSNWRPVVMPPEKHLAYAIQWFGLAIAATVIVLVLIRKERRRNASI